MNDRHYVNLEETVLGLTMEEREVIFRHITDHPELYKKVLGNLPIIDNIMNAPEGVDNPLIIHYQNWKKYINS